MVLLGIVVALFIYPFVSQCIHNWASSDIGEGNGPGGSTIITSAEWNTLTHTCFGEVNAPSYTESRVMAGFELVGSLTYILVSLWVFLAQIFRNLKAQGPGGITQSRSLASIGKILGSFTAPSWFRKLGHIVLLLCPLFLSIPLIFGIFRLRDVQKALAKATKSAYFDNEWGFGQVVAVVVFAPVNLDMICSYFEIE